MSARLALLVGAALLCGGCEVTSDTGKPCVLVKKAASGEGAVPVSPNDIVRGQDFISFGAVECEDLVCVRTGGTPIETTGEGSAVQVLGYCSKACNANSTDCASTHPDTTEATRSSMSCRAILLDQLALTTLKREDPATYESIFGKNESPNYCASSASGS
jgi:hypothetical protein